MPLIHEIPIPAARLHVIQLPGEAPFGDHPPIDRQMVRVPGGSFTIGDGSDEENKPAPREVSDFWMARTPVTQALWQAVMGSNPSRFSGSKRPVECVSWFDAVEFCNRLSDLLQRKPYYVYDKQQDKWTIPDSKGNGYRLPTEAEWEYAARWPHPPAPSPFRSAAWRGGETAGSQVASPQPEAGAPPLQNARMGILERGPGGEVYSGSHHLPEVGWYNDNSHGETAEVALKLPNALGLYDMSGNVWEWCGDWRESSYPEKVKKDYLGPEFGSYRVLRGGSWNLGARYCRPVSRHGYHPGHRFLNIGLRLACGCPAVRG